MFLWPPMCYVFFENGFFVIRERLQGRPLHWRL